MKLKSFDHMNCSLALTLDVIGERWTLLILREAFFGKKRFEEFQKRPRHRAQHPDCAPQSARRARAFSRNARSKHGASNTC